MGFKEKMMEGMMGSMTGEERKEMMDKMMNNFFSNMTKEEKQEMMNNMMPKMMGMMMGGGEQGMGSNMMGSMMKSMMSGKHESGDSGFNPMDMCRKMMSTIAQSSEIATFATPEVRQMFEDWAQQVDEEILNYVNESGSVDPEEIAAHLKISKNSVIYFLSRLAQKGKLNIKVEKQENQDK